MAEISGHGHGHHRSLSSSGPSASRPSYIDASALSPAEYSIYVKWVNSIKPSRSGEAEHLDEQDVLRFLREECGIEIQDEIKILSLFERFPLGLLPGHFFAMLRLASHVQRGEAPSKILLFTQAPPPRLGVKKSGPIPPPPQHASTTTTNAQAQRQSSLSLPKRRPSEVNTSIEVIARASSAHYPQATIASQAVVQHPHPPAVPDDSTKPSVNPFRSHHNQSAPANPTSSGMLGSAILGFDPAPNPFKQFKPKVVRPTPIVADASTSVLGAPSMPAVNPFHSGASAPSTASHTPQSGRSIAEEHDHAGPPLPPRPADTSGGDLRPPPPLPPRHISPLIQAGLHARSEVKKRKEALPPKTFTVLQSTSDRHPFKETPRLLTGQAAPSIIAVPGPSVPRKKSGDRGSATSAAGATSHTKAPVSIAITTEQSPKNRVGPLPPTIAPKPSYVGKGKQGVPAWLREQEQIQKSSPLDHHNTSGTAPQDRLVHSRSSSRARSKKRTTSTVPRIEFLDNDSDDGISDAEDGTLSEQARSAASIDRNNPFFQHSRDANKRGVDLKETLSKLAVENAVAKAERDSKYKTKSDDSTAQGTVNENRPLGRSKTLREGSRSGMNGISNVLGGPPVPPRRKMEAFPAIMDSGTYPGFGKSARVEGPTVGGLRQTPVSKKADVGLPASVLAERERLERERVEKLAAEAASERTTPMPPPPVRRRPSSTSQVSVTDSSTTTPRSPNDDVPPLAIHSIAAHGKRESGGGGIRERVNEMLKADLTSISERHDWLARAAERAKGGPLNDARIGLMDDPDDFGRDEKFDDAPEVDDDYLEEVRRQQRRQQRYSTIDLVGGGGGTAQSIGSNEKDRATPTNRNRPSSNQSAQRRATDQIRRSLSGFNAAIVRRSSLLARGGSHYSDDRGDNDDSNYQDASALILDDDDDDGVAPDVDPGNRSHGSLEEETRHARASQNINEQAGWQQLH